ncbi:hypothetical protein B296_00020236 [Ensete ventricosum]|uniref:Peptidase A1 domain-containing protein n=1 Tax=Ensete ventricosum TaxID=4639 RepID=A0A426YWF0_ENSVE|nr:hypothetical protein B296_00020236 [Ensete ventricosum]
MAFGASAFFLYTLSNDNFYDRLSVMTILLHQLSHSFAKMSFCTRPPSSCTITIASAPTSSGTFPTPFATDDGFYTCSPTLLHHCPLPLPSPYEAPSFFIATKPSSTFSHTLALGTLPHRLPLLLDTSNRLTWVPCTSSYQCRSCSSPSAAPVIPFLPKSSSSIRLIGCHNPRCLWIHPRDRLSRCPSCNSTSADGCPVVPCPPYALIYGTDSTAGLLMLETLIVPHRTVPDFGVGCSILSESQPTGVVGFDSGRWGSSASPYSFAEGSSSLVINLL